MNRKTMKTLLIGKKPRLQSRGKRYRQCQLVSTETLKLDAMLNDSALRVAYDQLRDIILRGLGIPAHLMR